MTYTPEQLREWAEYLAGRGSVWTLPDGIPKPSDLFRAHADALEELARVKAALAESERKIERLKFHAEGMWLDLKTIAHEEQYALAKSAADYRAEFKEE